MAKQHWLVTTQSKFKKPSGELDISTFSSGTDMHPVDVLIACRTQQPDRYWALMLAIPITAAQAKKLAEPPPVR